MKKLLNVLAIILVILATSCAPKLHKTASKSEVKQWKFVAIWTGVGVAIIAVAMEQAIEDERQFNHHH